MQFTLPEMNIKQFIEEQQSSFELTLENKVKREAEKMIEVMVKEKLLSQVETEIKLFFDAKSTEILGKLPTRMDEKVETVINHRIIKYIENHASSSTWLKSVFDSRWWPQETKVLSYVESIVQKKLELCFNDHLQNLIEKYIRRIWVVDIKDMQDEIMDLNHNISDAANYWYEAGQRDASR